jgi:hypothetical protein
MLAYEELKAVRVIEMDGRRGGQIRLSRGDWSFWVFDVSDTSRGRDVWSG